MKKRIARLLLAVMLAGICLTATSCSGLFGGASTEIALITDGSDITESALMESLWGSVENFARINNKSCAYYVPVSKTKDDLADMMMQSIVRGAKIVICPGDIFSTAVFRIQDLFPDVCFLLLDGIPNDGVFDDDPDDDVENDNSGTTACENVKISSNVCCVSFHEEQAGFLAGYMAVLGGYSRFGVIADSDSSANLHYIYGFIQGVDFAGTSSGLPERLSVKYQLSGKALSTDNIKSIATEWYIGGTEIIFAVGGARKTVISVAESLNGRVICSGTDGSLESNIVITSAIKNYERVVADGLISLYSNGGKWDEVHAGRQINLGVGEGSVGIPTDSGAWRLGTVPVESYDDIVTRMKMGEVNVSLSPSVLQNLKINIEFRKLSEEEQKS